MPGIIRKDGCLMHWAIIAAVALFMLFTCQDNERSAKAKAAEEARIEREVARRVGVARQEMAGRDALFHTVSWIVLVVLTCGGVAKFIWFRQPRFTSPVMPVIPTNRAVRYNPPAYALEQKYGVRQAQLRTIRAVGFILLAGGALGGLIWLQRNHACVPPQPGERNLQMPTWLDHFALRPNRVLDLPPHQLPPSPASPAPQDAWNQTNSTPPRRRARRRRHRNRTHRLQDHDETPSHR